MRDPWTPLFNTISDEHLGDPLSDYQPEPDPADVEAEYEPVRPRNDLDAAGEPIR